MVLDNAAIHTGKENTVLEDYLWETYGIFLLFPTKKGAIEGDENSPRNSAVKNISQRGEGYPLSPATSLAPHYGGGDGAAWQT